LKLNKTFQDKKNLYFALEYCSNKDLGFLLNKLGKLDFKLAQYFASQILSAISYMHKEGIYHRDLKPENIGIDKYFQLKLFDFATAIKINKFFDKKIMRFIDLNQEEENIIKEKIEKNEIGEDNIIKIDKHNILLLQRLFVGTPEYVSPEVLEHDYNNIGPSVDIWAFGVILYLFFFGRTPFKAKTEQETLDNIKNVKYNFDEDDNDKNIPEEVKDLISKILIKDPSKRIGYNSYDYTEIKNHPFFKGINFNNLESDQGPILEMKEILEKFGYQIEKILTEEERQMSLIKELYDEEEEKEENNIKSKSAKDIGNNIHELKKDLKGKTVEYKNEIVEEEDKIILEEKLQKKSPWLHYNTRLVIFYSKGHIDYFEPDTKKLKGSFVINSQCKAIVIDEYRFEVQTLNRSYFFKHKTKKIANEWVDKINKYISDFSQKYNK
jgi:serine/threonine protein kinase